jgi:hypothetical protein
MSFNSEDDHLIQKQYIIEVFGKSGIRKPNISLFFKKDSEYIWKFSDEKNKILLYQKGDEQRYNPELDFNSGYRIKNNKLFMRNEDRISEKISFDDKEVISIEKWESVVDIGLSNIARYEALNILNEKGIRSNYNDVFNLLKLNCGLYSKNNLITMFAYKNSIFRPINKDTVIISHIKFDKPYLLLSENSTLLSYKNCLLYPIKAGELLCLVDSLSSDTKEFVSNFTIDMWNNFVISKAKLFLIADVSFPQYLKDSIHLLYSENIKDFSLIEKKERQSKLKMPPKI